jgi:hypothetical protein
MGLQGYCVRVLKTERELASFALLDADNRRIAVTKRKPDVRLSCRLMKRSMLRGAQH